MRIIKALHSHVSIDDCSVSQFVHFEQQLERFIHKFETSMYILSHCVFVEDNFYLLQFNFMAFFICAF